LLGVLDGELDVLGAKGRVRVAAVEHPVDG
jgi:hypothetical protein